MWYILAIFFAIPRVANWIIKYAQKTPYSHIPNRNNTAIYMERFWLFNPYDKINKHKWGWRKLFPSIRVHHIMLPDDDGALHDHPWNFRTFILKGFYWDARHNRGSTRGHLRYQGDTIKMKTKQYHRITQISDGGVWTLFITYKYREDWGFEVNGVKVPHKEYLKGKGLQNDH